MSWGEFCVLLSGLDGKTPLGRIVQIRAETDRDVIKRFTPEEKRIRRDWQRRSMKQHPISETDYKKAMDQLEGIFTAMAGKEG